MGIMCVEALSSFMLLVFVGASTFFIGVSAILFLKFLMSDSEENRDLLPKALVASFIGDTVMRVGVWMAMSGMISGGISMPGMGSGGIIGTIFGVAINALFAFYYYKVMI